VPVGRKHEDRVRFASGELDGQIGFTKYSEKENIRTPFNALKHHLIDLKRAKITGNILFPPNSKLEVKRGWDDCNFHLSKRVAFVQCPPVSKIYDVLPAAKGSQSVILRERKGINWPNYHARLRFLLRDNGDLFTYEALKWYYLSVRQHDDNYKYNKKQRIDLPTLPYRSYDYLIWDGKFNRILIRHDRLWEIQMYKVNGKYPRDISVNELMSEYNDLLESFLGMDRSGNIMKFISHQAGG
jgi:hypothetical protein